MSRIGRMFEIIQMLRSTGSPLTAEAMAGALEVTKRTVYRDIAALQAMRVPIEGEAGIGYVMHPGYDLPPLMFDPEEIEAIVVGLAMLGRTGDKALLAAARRVGDKIADVLPGDADRDFRSRPLYASDWTTIPGSVVQPATLRRAIRDEERLRLTYTDGARRETRRTVRPLAIIYYIEAVVLAAWCELRDDFRHFRVDRISAYAAAGKRFHGQGERLRALWREKQRLP
jgi:predicted DNA-binding transcriptional regulator YafY